jgi:hypothetical protein
LAEAYPGAKVEDIRGLHDKGDYVINGKYPCGIEKCSFMAFADEGRGVKRIEVDAPNSLSTGEIAASIQRFGKPKVSNFIQSRKEVCEENSGESPGELRVRHVDDQYTFTTANVRVSVIKQQAVCCDTCRNTFGAENKYNTIIFYESKALITPGTY